jgi:hypothetical protein
MSTSSGAIPISQTTTSISALLLRSLLLACPRRHKGTDVISRNEAFEAARAERLAAAEFAQQKPAGGSRHRQSVER